MKLVLNFLVFQCIYLEKWGVRFMEPASLYKIDRRCILSDFSSRMREKSMHPLSHMSVNHSREKEKVVYGGKQGSVRLKDDAQP